MNCDLCDQPGVAQDLCAKHYMRLRRTGSPEEVRKPGRHKSSIAKTTDDFHLSDGVSPRTRAKYIKAFTFLADIGDPSIYEQVVMAASRPNGSLNASKLLQLAEQAWLMNWVKTFHPEHQATDDIQASSG